MDPIVIVYCSDDDGADFMLVAIKSMLANNSDSPTEIHILTNGFSPQTRLALHELETCFNRTITVHGIDSSCLSGFPTVNRPDLKIPLAMYFRLFMEEALPASVRKAIYLDTDTIVEKPLRELWETDLGDNILGAIPEPYLAGTPHLSEIGLDANDIYFNSGVMLMNLDMMRNEHTGRRCIDWVKANKAIATSPDQDALNVIAKGRTLMLHPRYNLHYTLMLRSCYGHFIPETEWEDAIADPVIVHYSGCKPWLRYRWGMKILRKKQFARYRNLMPVTTIKRRPVVRIQSFAGYALSSLKNSRLAGPIYRLCPGTWSKIGGALRHILFI